MRGKLGFTIVAMALLAIGIGAGILIQRQIQMATVRAAEELARDLTGMNAPLPPAPAWEEWTYPGSDLKKSGTGGSIRINREIVVPADHHGVWTTADPFEDVIRHYAEMLDFEDPDSFAEWSPGFGGGTYGTISSETGPTTNAHMTDNGNSDALERRPVRVECLTRRTRSYTVAIFISRADDEDLTHVIVLYSPLAEPATPAEHNTV